MTDIKIEKKPSTQTQESMRSDFAGVVDGLNLQALSPAVRFDRISIACQGLVFDRKHLCADLGIAIDAPLVELLAVGFMTYGTDLAKQLVGQFQFAIYDHVKCELYAVISPMCFDGFFYTEQNGQLIFSTSMPTLKALVGKPLKLNPKKITQLLILDHSTEDETFYQDVKRLPGGMALVYKDGKATISRFWSAYDVSQSLTFRDRRDYYQYGADLFSIITREMLEQTGTPVSQLSGGLDSSCVSAFLANHLKKQNEQLICVGTAPEKGFEFPVRKNWHVDDTAKMRDLADYNGNIDLRILRDTEHHVMPFDMAKFCFEHSDGPLRNACNIGWGMACQQLAKAEGHGYLYCGSAGNVTLSWAGTSTGLYRRARGFAGKCKRALLSRVQTGLFYSDYSAVNPSALLKYEYTQPSYTINKSISQAESIMAFCEAMSEGGGIINAVNRQSDTVMLDPTADLRFAEFCLQVPNEVYYVKGMPRSLVRGMCEDLLPDSIRITKTRGEQNAMWFYQMREAVKQYKVHFDQYRQIDLISELIDLDTLEKVMVNFEQCDPFKQPARFLTSEYRLKMARALHVAHWMWCHYQ